MTQKYVFVDVGMNSVARVKAPTLNEAWKKYINYRISQLPEPWEARPPRYDEVRKDLEHSVFVVSEDTEIKEIE